MKKIFLILLAAFFANAIFAQTNLQEVSDALSKNKITRGEFYLERFSTKANRAIKSNGNFTIAPENGIIWFTKNPIKTTQVVTNDFMLTENSRGTRTKIQSDENKIYSQMAALTSALFSGNLNAIEQNAQLDFSCQGENWRVEIFPRDASIKAMLEKISIAGKFSKKSCVATEMQIVFKNGDSTFYQLRGHEFFDTLTNDEKSFFEENP
ncbi:MAG: outer membrane lipoprotein carrier protein LolA [Treponemataceae bacterium]|nr:outer membrane lipoprotein carrier protein LolA [Treponemataceae bacterium]